MSNAGGIIIFIIFIVCVIIFNNPLAFIAYMTIEICGAIIDLKDKPTNHDQ